MPTVEFRVYRLRLVFRPTRRLQLRVWSGVVAGKIFYEALTKAGMTVERGGFFRVTPISRAGSSVPVGGWLGEGEPYEFQAYIWSVPGYIEADDVVRAFNAGVMMVGDNIEVETIEVETLVHRIPHPDENLLEGEPIAYTLQVEYMPTYYRFHGSTIAYPSPRRMLASIARRISATTTIDYREHARQMTEYIELIADQTRRQRIQITHGKQQLVFHGTAKYYIVAPRKLAETLDKWLQIAQHMGLGGSPGLGLGHIKNTTKQPPPPKTPPPVTPWAEPPTEDTLQ